MNNETAHAILAELTAIRRLLEGRRPDSEQRDVDLLATMHRAIGERSFSAQELHRHALLPLASELRQALERAIGDTSPRRIGKALRRLEGVNLGGIQVAHVGTVRDGQLWALQVCGSDNRQTRTIASSAARGRSC